jgi:hypothetical protein
VESAGNPGDHAAPGDRDRHRRIHGGRCIRFDLEVSFVISGRLHRVDAPSTLDFDAPNARITSMVPVT